MSQKSVHFNINILDRFGWNKMCIWLFYISNCCFRQQKHVFIYTNEGTSNILFIQWDDQYPFLILLFADY